MPEDLYELMGDKRYTGVQRDDWMIGVNAIVAKNDDPEHRHRVKVVIPSIDENEIHDKWCDRLVWWAGSPGYGDFHIPEIGSEVVLFGRLSEKYVLFFISRFNEDYPVPKDFWRPPDTRGFRTDGDYKSIVELDHQLRAGRFLIESDSSVRIIAPAGLWVGGRRIG
jgi:Type VI secretion system/phage-baseplate injector OB domain